MSTNNSRQARQTTNRVMMIRPVRFEGNAQTAATNAFQTELGEFDAAAIQRAALAEFDNYVGVLRAAGVTVTVIEDTPEPHTPDSMFPNNWISFHEGGTVVLYPMFTANRRQELRPELITEIEAATGLAWSNVEDLSDLHNEGGYLEGTGSLVLDREHCIAYACRSPRTNLAGLKAFEDRMQYELVVFDSISENGAVVFHTNVMMGIGSDFAIVCLDSIPNKSERDAVVQRLSETGHVVIPITLGQMQQFAGNFLALRTSEGQPLAVFSSGAFQCLNQEQRSQIEGFARVIHSPLETIESHGGGGARCMLAEVFGNPD